MPGYEAIGEEESEQVLEVFRNGGVLFRQGFEHMRQGVFKVADFERAFADYMGVEQALAVTSGTAALRVALAALRVEPGSEIIIPSFTFVATAEAVIEAGAVPVCVEIDETLNLDPSAVAAEIGPRTAGVIAVHMLGTPARLRELRDVCAKAEVPLIEDSAWGCGGALDGRKLGTWGRIGTYSFDFAKTITTGEGGMLVFSDANDAAAARAWHDHGHDNNPAVPRWEDTRASSGFNFRMMELQGAVGLAQLSKLDSIVSAQRTAHGKLRDALSDLPGLEVRPEPDGSLSTCDAFVFQVPDQSVARRCRDMLVAAGGTTKILPEAVTWHFAAHWDHMPAVSTRFGNGLREAFPRSAAILGRCVALPVSAVGAGIPPELVRSTIEEALAFS